MVLGGGVLLFLASVGGVRGRELLERLLSSVLADSDGKVLANVQVVEVQDVGMGIACADDLAFFLRSWCGWLVTLVALTVRGGSAPEGRGRSGRCISLV